MKKNNLLPLFGLLFITNTLLAQDREIIQPVNLNNGNLFKQIIPSSVNDNNIVFNAQMQNNNILGCVLKKDRSNDNNIFATAYINAGFATRIRKIVDVPADAPWNTSHVHQLIAIASFQEATSYNPVTGILVYKHTPVILWLDPVNGTILNSFRIDGFTNYGGILPVDMETNGTKFEILISTASTITTEVPKLNYLHIDFDNPANNLNTEIFIPGNPLILNGVRLFKANYTYDAGYDGVFICGFTGSESIGDPARFGFLAQVQFGNNCPNFQRSISISDPSGSGLRSITAEYNDGNILMLGQKWNNNIFAASFDLGQPSPVSLWDGHEYIPDEPNTTFPTKYQHGGNGNGSGDGFTGLSVPPYSAPLAKTYTFYFWGELVQITSAPMYNFPFIGQNLGPSSTFGMASEISSTPSSIPFQGSSTRIVCQRHGAGTDDLAKFYYLKRADYNTCLPPTTAVEVPFSLPISYNQFSFNNGPLPVLSSISINQYDITLSTNNVACNVYRAAASKEDDGSNSIKDLNTNSLKVPIPTTPEECEILYQNEIVPVLWRQCGNMVLIPWEKNLGTKEFLTSAKAGNENEVKIYPNPSHDFFMVNGANIKDIEVFNSAGQIMLTKKSNGKNNLLIDCSSWARGLYIVKILSNTNEMFYKKIILQ